MQCIVLSNNACNCVTGLRFTYSATFAFCLLRPLCSTLQLKLKLFSSRLASGLSLRMVKKRGGKRKHLGLTQDNDELFRAKAEYYGPSSSQTENEDYYDPSPRYKYADAYKDCYTSPVASHSKVPRRSPTPIHSTPAWRLSSPFDGNQTRSISLFASRPVTVHPKEAVIPPEPIPTSPSESYLALSKEPSITVPHTDTTRKLLILDLNGTLLIRSTHTQPGRLRTSHPRAYLPSFVSYLFQDETMKWLDTMVWSSAMPHSVADMVTKAFPGERERLSLKAIWARDELGLGREEYGERKILQRLLYTFQFAFLREEDSNDQGSGETLVSTDKSPFCAIHHLIGRLAAESSRTAIQPCCCTRV